MRILQTVDDDIINVALAMSKFTLGYFKDNEDFIPEVIRIVGMRRYEKFKDFMNELSRACDEAMANNSNVVDLRKYKRTRKWNIKSKHDSRAKKTC